MKFFNESFNRFIIKISIKRPKSNLSIPHYNFKTQMRNKKEMIGPVLSRAAFVIEHFNAF